MDMYDRVLLMEERVVFLRGMLRMARRRRRVIRRRIRAHRQFLHDHPGGGDSSLAYRHELTSLVHLKHYWGGGRYPLSVSLSRIWKQRS